MVPLIMRIKRRNPGLKVKHFTLNFLFVVSDLGEERYCKTFSKNALSDTAPLLLCLRSLRFLGFFSGRESSGSNRLLLVVFSLLVLGLFFLKDTKILILKCCSKLHFNTPISRQLLSTMETKNCTYNTNLNFFFIKFKKHNSVLLYL